MAQNAVEVWRNTAAGVRWYVGFDQRGAEKVHMVPGNKTFTVTTMERQLNQSKAAEPELDLFRNGTFVLAKPSDETDQGEIESPNALTDAEVEQLVRDIIHGDGSVSVEDAIKDIDSAVTLQRIYEELVLEDAPASVVAFVDARKKSLDPGAPVERQVVTTAPGGAKRTPRKSAPKE